jgi:ribosomal protein L7/L12
MSWQQVLKDEYGIEPAAAAVAVAAGPAAGGEAAAEEKTSFDVVLTELVQQSSRSLRLLRRLVVSA